MHVHKHRAGVTGNWIKALLLLDLRHVAWSVSWRCDCILAALAFSHGHLDVHETGMAGPWFHEYNVYHGRDWNRGSILNRDIF